MMRGSAKRRKRRHDFGSSGIQISTPPMPVCGLKVGRCRSMQNASATRSPLSGKPVFQIAL
jgi:hypothetical protein